MAYGCGANGRRRIQRKTRNVTEETGDAKQTGPRAWRCACTASGVGIRLFESGIHRDGIRIRAAGAGAVVVKQRSLRRCMACEINELVETARAGEGCSWIRKRKKTCTAAAMPLWKKAAVRILMRCGVALVYNRLKAAKTGTARRGEEYWTNSRIEVELQSMRLALEPWREQTKHRALVLDSMGTQRRPFVWNGRRAGRRAQSESVVIAVGNTAVALIPSHAG
ncbi:hypothetical protein B0H13DRAFT_2042402 [Mycena leptocephala]|nr:hypothetical protein B0H13DRAFT_2042402 [Mycena leptocephala]